MKKKISICVPVLNEEKNISILYRKINNFFVYQLKNKYNYEIIFTDNASTDNTEEEIVKIYKKHKNIKYFRFKKNIGYDLSLLKNYQLSSGNSAISLHCDLQDPIEKIKDFIFYWSKGYDLVYGKITQRNEGVILTFFRKIYYFLFNLLCFVNKKLPANAVDFRLLDKKILTKIKKYQGKYHYARGLTFFFSKNSQHINYSRKNRKFGKSKFNLKNSIFYAINSLIFNTDLKIYCIIGILFNIMILLFNNHFNFFIILIISFLTLIFLYSLGFKKINLKKIKYAKVLR